jgi:hypothetical protein
VSEIRIRRVTAILPGFAMNYIISEDVRGVPSFSRIVTRSCGLSSKRAQLLPFLRKPAKRRHVND